MLLPFQTKTPDDLLEKVKIYIQNPDELSDFDRMYIEYCGFDKALKKYLEESSDDTKTEV